MYNQNQGKLAFFYIAKSIEVHENKKPFKCDVCWLNLQKEFFYVIMFYQFMKEKEQYVRWNSSMIFSHLQSQIKFMKTKNIKCDVCSPGFIKNFFDFMFMKNQILNDIEKSFSCQFCNAKFVVEKLLTDQLHSSMLTNN